MFKYTRNSGLSSSAKYRHALYFRVVEFLIVKPGGTSRNNSTFNGGFSHTVLDLTVHKKVDFSGPAKWFIASDEAPCPTQLFFTGAFASLRKA